MRLEGGCRRDGWLLSVLRVGGRRLWLVLWLLWLVPLWLLWMVRQRRLLVLLLLSVLLLRLLRLDVGMSNSDSRIGLRQLHITGNPIPSSTATNIPNCIAVSHTRARARARAKDRAKTRARD